MDRNKLTDHVRGRVVSGLEANADHVALRFGDRSALIIEHTPHGVSVVLHERANRGPARSKDQPTARQDEYLDFIRKYMARYGRSPAETDIADHFMVSAPSAHLMIKTLERRGFIKRGRLLRQYRAAVDPRADRMTALGTNAPSEQPLSQSIDAIPGGFVRSCRAAALLAVALMLHVLVAAVSAQEAAPRLLLNPGAPAWSERAPEVFLAHFSTTRGDFTIEVTRAWAPRGADRFHNLVRHGYYDGVRINRVVAGFIAQFGVHGDPEVTAAWKGRVIGDDPVVASNTRGSIAFATTGPDTRHTQVYISLADNTRLDAQGFAPFGRVVQGMDVVERLYSGYGEEAGGGMRGGRQGPIEAEGNAWLDRHYPLLDRIRSARVVAAAGLGRPPD